MKRSSILMLILGAAALIPASCADDKQPHTGTGGSGGTELSCVTNEDCGEDGLVCVEKVCSPCATDLQCGRIILQCDPATSACRFRVDWGDECTEHTDCSAGSLCVQGLCKPTTADAFCGGLGQCDEGMRCQRHLNVCEEDLGCHVPEDCQEDETCNPGTEVCALRCTPDTEDEVCTGFDKCDSRGLCVQCESSADCSPGLVCNVEAGVCTSQGSCINDRECPAGDICNPATKTCTPPLPPCHSNNDCQLDERCEVSTGECVSAACRPDQKEPNDAKETATVLDPGTVSNLTACEGNEDWYKLTLTGGDKISITIESDILAADGLRATLIDDLGRDVMTNPYTVSTTAPANGIYYLRIRTIGQRVKYNLVYLRASGTPCGDDRFEENDAATAAAAITLGPPLRGLKACSADPDYYVVAVTPGKALRVQLSHDPTKGLLELVLWDSDATDPGGGHLLGSADGSAVEVVQGTPDGRAYIQVSAGSRTIDNGYELEITEQ